MKNTAKSGRRNGEWKRTARTAVLMSFVTVASLLTTCCGGLNEASPAALPIPAISGSVFGGRQPISGATLHLYAAGTSGYAGTNTDLLTTPVSTMPDGTFTITSDYSCTAGQQMYIVSIGGDPGAGTNPQAGILAALGDCANLNWQHYDQHERGHDGRRRLRAGSFHGKLLRAWHVLDQHGRAGARLCFGQ
jgi:hypothetical protein